MTPLFERVLIAALAWGAFSFGAVYPWGYWPLAAVCTGLGLYAIIRTRSWHDVRARNLGIALAVVGMAISIQLIALPYAILEKLSPAFDGFFREYTLAYHPASLHPLTIEPLATSVALALFIAFALLLIGLVTGIPHVSLEWVVNQVMGLGLALAVVGVVQKALIEPTDPLVYGFWRPLLGGSPGLRSSNPFGPFINRNNFAGWMVMALPIVVAYSYVVLVRSRGPGGTRWTDKLRWITTVDASRFWLVCFSALLMGMTIVLSGSRSGMAAFAAAMLVFGYFVLRHAKDRRARWIVAGYLTVMIGAAIVWAGSDATVRRFVLVASDTSAAGRFGAWQDTARIIADFPIFGTGLGTYGQAMLIYQTGGRPAMYSKAHNEYLQIVAEGGAMVAIPVAVALGLVVFTIRRRLTVGTDDPLTYWIRVGALAGLVGIAAQSLVEFSLQIPGNRVLFVLLLAIAMHRPRSTVPLTQRPRRRMDAKLDAHRV